MEKTFKESYPILNFFELKKNFPDGNYKFMWEPYGFFYLIGFWVILPIITIYKILFPIIYILRKKNIFQKINAKYCALKPEKQDNIHIFIKLILFILFFFGMRFWMPVLFLMYCMTIFPFITILLIIKLFKLNIKYKTFFDKFRRTKKNVNNETIIHVPFFLENIIYAWVILIVLNLLGLTLFFIIRYFIFDTSWNEFLEWLRDSVNIIFSLDFREMLRDQPY